MESGEERSMDDAVNVGEVARIVHNHSRDRDSIIRPVICISCNRPFAHMQGKLISRGQKAECRWKFDVPTSNQEAIMSTDTKIHYTPCGCNSKCKKQCPCERRDICCEKYCGCSKQCNNRYRGCYCVAERCRSNDCPCFVAERECDPDICRNCWVSCGYDSTGEPRKTRSCYNMNIFDGPSKKVYRGKSKVAGWGAFTTETISKDEFIGEYTGELVLQEVALEKQGDHPCTSYIFDLDDKYVIDAQHIGGLLKYANHASNPNCYSKIIFVGRKWRIGIFATWNIEAGEELFIDYGPEFGRVWENINKVNHSSDGSMAAEPNSRPLRLRRATKLATEDAASR